MRAIRLGRDVAGDGGRVAAGAPDRGDRSFERALERMLPLAQGARGADDLGALPGEKLGDRAADSPACPGDDCDLAVEFAHVDPSYLARRQTYPIRRRQTRTRDAVHARVRYPDAVRTPIREG